MAGEIQELPLCLPGLYDRQNAASRLTQKML
jgi:hypothetical protein